MIFRSINYFFSEAIRNLIRNHLMTIASIITVSSCIFMVIISYCLAANVDAMLKQFEDRIGITAIIKDDVDSDTVNALFNKINAMEHIKTVKYITAEEALQKLIEDMGDNEDLFAGLENDNPLPREFSLEIDNLAYHNEVIAQLEALIPEGIDKVTHGKSAADAIMTISNILRILCIFIIAALAVISIVIITNTIKIAVNSRKTEINIMKYVGATDWFIRWPFLLEGMIIGVLGALFPIIVSWTGYARVIGIISERVTILNNLIDFLPAITVFTSVMPLSLLMGVLIGVSGSVMSIRRHLKV